MAEEKKKKRRSLKKRAPRAKKETVKKKEISEVKQEEVKEAAPEVKEPEKKVAKEEPKAAEKKPEKKAKKKKTEAQLFYGTGRRKTSIARVYLHGGKGEITVNQKDYKDYFLKRPILISQVEAPLRDTETFSSYDINARVCGGGIPAQALAVSMGIARALDLCCPDKHKILRQNDYLMRDPREKERKKYGRKRARKSFQYTKR